MGSLGSVVEHLEGSFAEWGIAWNRVSGSDMRKNFAIVILDSRRMLPRETAYPLESIAVLQ